jgi:Nitrate and nitrite sensing
MSGTALDHRLVRDYLRELDKAMRGLPDSQARELKEQITAHLDDALQPGAGDHEVIATLSRLGSPADLAAEAGAASALQISGDVSSYAASGRVQHLARLDAAVVTLTQKLEDERDLSAAYAAREGNGPLTHARAATDAAASAVRADAAGVGAGYSPGTVQDLKALLAGLTVLGDIRGTVTAPGVIPLYSLDVIRPAITFSTAAGDGTGDARLQATVTTLAALLRVENELSVQRAILYAALSARPPVLAPADLTSLRQPCSSSSRPTWATSTPPRTRPSSGCSRTPCPVRR